MTLIVANLTHMAADSRIVGDVVHHSDKLRITKRGTVVGAAGDWDHCLAFLGWAERGFAVRQKPDLGKGEFEALELAPDGLWLWSKRLSRYRVTKWPFHAIGNGAQGAMVALLTGSDLKPAMQAVAEFDESIGPPFIELALPTRKRR